MVWVQDCSMNHHLSAFHGHFVALFLKSDGNLFRWLKMFSPLMPNLYISMQSALSSPCLFRRLRSSWLSLEITRHRRSSSSTVSSNAIKGLGHTDANVRRLFSARLIILRLLANSIRCINFLSRYLIIKRNSMIHTRKTLHNVKRIGTWTSRIIEFFCHATLNRFCSRLQSE